MHTKPLHFRPFLTILLHFETTRRKSLRENFHHCVYFTSMNIKQLFTIHFAHVFLFTLGYIKQTLILNKS